MIKSRYVQVVLAILISVFFHHCEREKDGKSQQFDRFSRSVAVGNWQYTLRVENLNESRLRDTSLEHQYLKATLEMTNTKTQASILYAASRNSEEYEKNYKYLAFDGKADLLIRSGETEIYPIGYVFEPSNGLARSERLVYKFQIDQEQFQKLKENASEVEYWYVDRLAGVGKICFKQQEI